ncbi:hypothetical protein [Aeromicrobium erythreum]|uniref:Uncharacterized protein n=1 Tax=Aeromicrobium erythreum TaxID=2041 RepID=A0A0U3T063_9ACTN|nr:hypothetical protein [Aeromicrobium erythreum]ALX04136.1 hypothetical protein AERYTH_05185 [Aeromicrobium erythreum]
MTATLLGAAAGAAAAVGLLLVVVAGLDRVLRVLRAQAADVGASARRQLLKSGGRKEIIIQDPRHLPRPARPKQEALSGGGRPAGQPAASGGRVKR